MVWFGKIRLSRSLRWRRWEGMTKVIRLGGFTGKSVDTLSAAVNASSRVLGGPRRSSRDLPECKRAPDDGDPAKEDADLDFGEIGDGTLLREGVCSARRSTFPFLDILCPVGLR